MQEYNPVKVPTRTDPDAASKKKVDMYDTKSD